MSAPRPRRRLSSTNPVLTAQLLSAVDGTPKPRSASHTLMRVGPPKRAPGSTPIARRLSYKGVSATVRTARRGSASRKSPPDLPMTASQRSATGDSLTFASAATSLGTINTATTRRSSEDLVGRSSVTDLANELVVQKLEEKIISLQRSVNMLHELKTSAEVKANMLEAHNKRLLRKIEQDFANSSGNNLMDALTTAKMKENEHPPSRRMTQPNPQRTTMVPKADANPRLEQLKTENVVLQQRLLLLQSVIAKAKLKVPTDSISPSTASTSDGTKDDVTSLGLQKEFEELQAAHEHLKQESDIRKIHEEKLKMDVKQSLNVLTRICANLSDTSEDGNLRNNSTVSTIASSRKTSEDPQRHNSRTVSFSQQVEVQQPPDDSPSPPTFTYDLSYSPEISMITDPASLQLSLEGIL